MAWVAKGEGTWDPCLSILQHGITQRIVYLLSFIWIWHVDRVRKGGHGGLPKLPLLCPTFTFCWFHFVGLNLSDILFPHGWDP